jgi:hypothetical protein
MKRTANGATMQQMDYAKGRLRGGKSKFAIAIEAGYKDSVARNALEKIESTVGYQNAMNILLKGSVDLVGDIMAEYTRRGFDKMSDKDLNGAINAITTAWERIGKQRGQGKEKDPNENPLRAAVMQRANTIINNPPIVQSTVVEATASEPSTHSPENIETDEQGDIDIVNQLDL